VAAEWSGKPGKTKPETAKTEEPRIRRGVVVALQEFETSISIGCGANICQCCLST
jgi:hypothetical protein